MVFGVTVDGLKPGEPVVVGDKADRGIRSELEGCAGGGLHGAGGAGCV